MDTENTPTESSDSSKPDSHDDGQEISAAASSAASESHQSTEQADAKPDKATDAEAKSDVPASDSPASDSPASDSPASDSPASDSDSSQSLRPVTGWLIAGVALLALAVAVAALVVPWITDDDERQEQHLADDTDRDINNNYYDDGYYDDGDIEEGFDDGNYDGEDYGDYDVYDYENYGDDDVYDGERSRGYGKVAPKGRSHHWDKAPDRKTRSIDGKECEVIHSFATPDGGRTLYICHGTVDSYRSSDRVGPLWGWGFSGRFTPGKDGFLYGLPSNDGVVGGFGCGRWFGCDGGSSFPEPLFGDSGKEFHGDGHHTDIPKDLSKGEVFENDEFWQDFYGDEDWSKGEVFENDEFWQDFEGDLPLEGFLKALLSALPVDLLQNLPSEAPSDAPPDFLADLLPNLLSELPPDIFDTPIPDTPSTQSRTSRSPFAFHNNAY